MNSPTFTFCPNCGKSLPLSEGVHFCPFCGKNLSPTEGHVASDEPIAQLLRINKKIEAIKLYREQTQSGLREAMVQVESIAQKYQIHPESSPSRPRNSIGKIGIGWRIVAYIWMGFMVATAGLAIFPIMAKVASPFVCEGKIDVESHHYNPYPGKHVTTRNFFCPDGREVTWKAVFFSFLIYTMASFFLCEALLLIGRMLP